MAAGRLPNGMRFGALTFYNERTGTRSASHQEGNTQYQPGDAEPAASVSWAAIAYHNLLRCGNGRAYRLPQTVLHDHVCNHGTKEH